MAGEFARISTPISIGASYRNGMSWYRVLAITDDTAVLLRQDGWMLTAHGAALYETRRGLELLWDYSTGGRFTREAT